MEKKYEVKDKEDSIKTFFLQYAERLTSEINYELRKKKRGIPDDVFGALYASIPDAVLNTMNSWCVFPKFFSKEYHFEVYLSNKEQQNYLGIYTVKAYSRDMAYESALTLVSDELKSSLPNMKFVDDIKKLLVIKSADKTWVSTECTSEKEDCVHHDTFDEAWAYVERKARDLVLSYCEKNCEVGVCSRKDLEKKSGYIRLHFPDTDSYTYLYVKEEE